jgi:hypothetical protein
MHELGIEPMFWTKHNAKTEGTACAPVNLN